MFTVRSPPRPLALPCARSDLNTFLKDVGAPAYAIPTGQIIGPFAPDPSGLESCLDEQYIGAMGRGNTNWYW